MREGIYLLGASTSSETISRVPSSSGGLGPCPVNYGSSEKPGWQLLTPSFPNQNRHRSARAEFIPSEGGAGPATGFPAGLISRVNPVPVRPDLLVWEIQSPYTDLAGDTSLCFSDLLFSLGGESFAGHTESCASLRTAVGIDAQGRGPRSLPLVSSFVFVCLDCFVLFSTRSVIYITKG